MMHHPMPLSSTRVLLVLQPLWCQQCHPHPHSMPFLNLKAAAQQSLLLLTSMSVSETPLPLRLQTADRRALITTALQLQSCHSQLQEPKPNPVITTHTDTAMAIGYWLLLATGYCWLPHLTILCLHSYWDFWETAPLLATAMMQQSPGIQGHHSHSTRSFLLLSPLSTQEPTTTSYHYLPTSNQAELLLPQLSFLLTWHSCYQHRAFNSFNCCSVPQD